jgi:hypothetical protein
VASPTSPLALRPGVAGAEAKQDARWWEISCSLGLVPPPSEFAANPCSDADQRLLFSARGAMDSTDSSTDSTAWSVVCVRGIWVVLVSGIHRVLVLGLFDFEAV